jgi:hypothetical protein
MMRQQKSWWPRMMLWSTTEFCSFSCEFEMFSFLHCVSQFILLVVAAWYSDSIFYCFPRLYSIAVPARPSQCAVHPVMLVLWAEPCSISLIDYKHKVHCKLIFHEF